MIVLGIDPGASDLKPTTGAALVRKQNRSYHTLWRGSGTTISAVTLVCALPELLEPLRSPTSWCVSFAVCVEDNTGVVEGKRRVRQTNHAASIGLVRTLSKIEGACVALKIPFGVLAPHGVRKVLGLPRNASKEQVHRMVSAIATDAPRETLRENFRSAAHAHMRPLGTGNELDAEAIAIAYLRLAT